MDAAKAALQTELLKEMPQFKDIVVSVSHGGKVANLVLNRPKSLNSLTQYGSYPELIKALRFIDTLPVVVFTRITGEGRFFSAGQDLKDIAESSPRNRGFTSRYDAQEEQHRMLWSGPGGAALALVEHTKITIMELNGPAIGWPACWIASGDLLLAAESCYVYMPFVTLGAMLEAGASMAWQWRIGAGLTLDMALTGRKVTAKELHTVGGVQRLWPDAVFRDEAKKMLDQMVETFNHSTMLEAKSLIRNPVRNALRTAIIDETYWQVARTVTAGSDTSNGFAKRQAELEAKKKQAGKL
ncbi:ClpP/crotonase-like domain-containing protein [Hyaloraphidium curvatum]|nr:ClpP/crotonase-like domain-containing protein [Hyaloraphidium curvatum]